MPAEPTVAVVGLRALARDIGRAGEVASPLNHVLSEAGMAAAGPVAERARSTYPVGNTGALAGDVRVTAARTGGTVRVGRAKVPYAGPVDFGGYPGDREYVADGRYLYPAAAGLGEQSAELYTAALARGFDNFAWSNEASAPEAIHD
jgi:hypothetical protein